MKKAVPKKIIVEWRYKPDLAFYGKMDSVGLELKDSLPDWQRSQLTLEARNRDQHRRVFLSFSRAFYEVDGPKAVETELETVSTVASAIAEHLDVLDTCIGIGVRFVFALEFEKEFSRLMERMNRLLFQRHEWLDASVEDIGYILDVKDDKWKGRVELGPMEKEQWFQVLPHERGVYTKEGIGSFEQYRKDFPSVFAHLNLDWRTEDPAKDYLGDIKNAQAKIMAHARKYITLHNK